MEPTFTSWSDTLSLYRVQSPVEMKEHDNQRHKIGFLQNVLMKKYDKCN